MSDPISEANRVIGLWEQAVHDYATLKYKAAETEVAYRVARANAWDATTGSVAAREKQVDRATEKESLARYRAAGDVEVHREMLRLYQAKAELRRTEIVNDRTLSGMGT